MAHTLRFSERELEELTKIMETLKEKTASKVISCIIMDYLPDKERGKEILNGMFKLQKELGEIKRLYNRRLKADMALHTLINPLVSMETLETNIEDKPEGPSNVDINDGL